MKRVWGNILRAAPVLGGAALIFSACVHDDSSIFVRSELAQPLGAQMGGVCTYTPDPTQPFVSSGLLDYTVRQQYDGWFLVGNQLVPESNPSQLMTETSTVTIQGGIVRITDTTGAQVADYTRLTSATIPPSSGTAPTFAPISITILDPITLGNSMELQKMVATVAPGDRSGLTRFITYTRFFGNTLGGKYIESDEFEFPIDVCVGCLINYTDNPSHNFPNCVPNLTSTTTTPVTPCIIGQDVPVDCNFVCTGIAACLANYN